MFGHGIDDFLNQGRVLPDNVVIRELAHGFALFPVAVGFHVPGAQCLRFIRGSFGASLGVFGIAAGSRQDAFSGLSVELLQLARIFVVDVLQTVLAVAEIEIGVEQYQPHPVD